VNPFAADLSASRPLVKTAIRLATHLPAARRVSPNVRQAKASLHAGGNHFRINNWLRNRPKPPGEDASDNRAIQIRNESELPSAGFGRRIPVDAACLGPSMTARSERVCADPRRFASPKRSRHPLPGAPRRVQFHPFSPPSKTPFPTIFKNLSLITNHLSQNPKIPGTTPCHYNPRKSNT
jgi:hypothetical protein